MLFIYSNPFVNRYAREDTHYLLYMYDLMRIRLLSASTEPECSENPLEEVSRQLFLHFACGCAKGKEVVNLLF